MEDASIVFSAPVVFKGESGNAPYLKLYTISDSEANFIQYSGAEYENESKFEVIKQSDGYVAIKSLHNGRYWTVDPNGWIKATNDFINEYCLFKPIVLEDKCVAFLTKSSNKYVKRYTLNNRVSFLNAATNVIDIHTPLKIEDASIVSIVFSTPVVFKGESGNAPYLKLYTISDSEANFIQYSGAEYENESKFEVIKQSDEYVAIKSLHNGRYWTVDPNGWIKATNDFINEYCLFKPIVLEDKCVAFLTKSSNKYVKRYTLNNRVSFLNAATNVIDIHTPLKIEDASIVSIVFSTPVVFKGESGNAPYLKLYTISDSEANFIQYSGAEYENESKFEVIKQSDGYVAIKSLHNGKYWTVDPNGWIKATNDFINEYCLFKPIVLEDKCVAFLTKSSNKYVKRYTLNNRVSFLNAATSVIDIHTPLKIEDASIASIVFSTPVVFKGESGNAPYLKLYTISNSEANFIQYSGTKYENESKFEVIKQSDGYVAIKSLHNGRYWTVDPNGWIKATNGFINENCLFKPIFLEDKCVAFLTKSSNKYVKRYTLNNRVSFLNAATSVIDIHTPIKIEEPH